jgi:hypothetical protein
MILGVAMLRHPQRAAQALYAGTHRVAKTQHFAVLQQQIGAGDLDVHGGSFHNAVGACTYHGGEATGGARMQS